MLQVHGQPVPQVGKDAGAQVQHRGEKPPVARLPVVLVQKKKIHQLHAHHGVRAGLKFLPDGGQGRFRRALPRFQQAVEEIPAGHQRHFHALPGKPLLLLPLLGDALQLFQQQGRAQLVLQQVVHRPHPQQGAHILVAVVVAQRQNGGLPLQLPGKTGHLHPRGPGHLHVKQKHVGRKLLQPAHGGLAVVHLGGNLVPFRVLV